MQVFPRVGLICILENSSIQMQNIPQNNYALSLFCLFTLHTTLPLCAFLPTCPLQLYQPILLDSNTNLSCIHMPALVVSLQQFRWAPSTTSPSDSVGQVARALSRTFYLLCQELAHGFMVTLTNPSDLPASNRKEEGQLRPASTRKAESPLASERGQQPLRSLFKGLNAMNTPWPGAHRIYTQFHANLYFPPSPL